MTKNYRIVMMNYVNAAFKSQGDLNDLKPS